jgi:hypothetical protein
MSTYDQKYQQVVNQLNAGRDVHIHISEYIPFDLLQPQQFNNIMQTHQMNIVMFSNKISHFSNQIVYLIQSIRIKSKEDILVEFRSLISSATSEILKFHIIMSKAKTDYKSMVIYMEMSLSNFFKVNHANVILNQMELYNLLSIIKQDEIFILELSSAISKLIIVLKSISVPEKISTEFNKIITSCIEEIESFQQSVNESIHMIWRIRGVIEGFLRLAS